MSIISTVDVVLLTLVEAASGDLKLKVALFKRDKAPFQGEPALVGGFIHEQEDRNTFESAMRVLQSKAGMSPPWLEQIKAFAGATRDPRGWSLSIAYYALVDAALIEKNAPDGLIFAPVDDLPKLPFDHKEIIEEAVRRVREKGFNTSLPAYLAGPKFTLPSLQAVYEAVIGEKTDKVSFRRKMLAMDFLQEARGAQFKETGGAPATFYRLKTKYRTMLAVARRGLNS